MQTILHLSLLWPRRIWTMMVRGQGLQALCHSMMVAGEALCQQHKRRTATVLEAWRQVHKRRTATVLKARCQQPNRRTAMGLKMATWERSCSGSRGRTRQRLHQRKWHYWVVLVRGGGCRI